MPEKQPISHALLYNLNYGVVSFCIFDLTPESPLLGISYDTIISHLHANTFLFWPLATLAFFIHHLTMWTILTQFKKVVD